MKKSTLLYLAAFLFLFASACKKADNQPTGYQYLFNDDFNNNAYNWAFNASSIGAQAYISNGELNYQFYPSTPNSTNEVAVSTGCQVNYDFDVQTAIANDNQMGLVIGAGNNHYGYSFFIDDVTGSFAVYDEGSSNVQAQYILNWQRSSAIKTSRAYNSLEIEQSGSRWYGYINNVKVFDIPSQPMYSDKFGFIILGNTQGYADYLTVKW